jgi:hypothetical protein
MATMGTMKARLLRVGVLAAVWSCGATLVRAQAAIVGDFSDDCYHSTDLTASQAELYMFKIARLSNEPDILFDARASGGARVEAALAPSAYLVPANWSNAVGGTEIAAMAATMSGSMAFDTGTFAAFDLGESRAQEVGSLVGGAPEVVATEYGYEIRFRPILQETPDIAPGCAIGGSPAVGRRPIIGMNLYRLAGAGAATLAQFRTQGKVMFVDLRPFDHDVVDVAGLGCSDLAAGDSVRLENPDGVRDSGDEVIVFLDTTRTPSGRSRADAPNPRAAYRYRLQPVMTGDPTAYERGATVSANHLPVATADRDGDGADDSVDLLADGRYELIDPLHRGLGLTWNGEILSSPNQGVGSPLTPFADTDGDGIPNDLETFYSLDPNVSNAGMDSDGDGPLDLLEAEAAASPVVADSDGAGERDGREMFYGRSPSNTCDDVVVSGVLGDVAPPGGGNGVVTIADVVRLLRFSVQLETPTPGEQVLGDMAPAELVDPLAVPPHWRRHGLPDGLGQHPFGRFEHGDGLVGVGDVVLALRTTVALMHVTD